MKTLLNFYWRLLYKLYWFFYKEVIGKKLVEHWKKEDWMDGFGGIEADKKYRKEHKEKFNPKSPSLLEWFIMIIFLVASFTVWMIEMVIQPLKLLKNKVFK